MATVGGTQTDDLNLDTLKRQLSDTTTACCRFIDVLEKHVCNKTDAISKPANESRNQLLQKIADLEVQLKLEREQSIQTLSESQQERIDALIVQYKAKIQDIEDKKIQVEGENRKLRMDLSACQKRLQEAEEVIASLTNAQSQQTTTDNEKIQMFETQLHIYQEDFDSERKERQQGLAKIASLEQTISILSRQLKMHQQQQQQLHTSLLPLNDMMQSFSNGESKPSPMHADSVAAEPMAPPLLKPAIDFSDGVTGK